jgi:hypothetical protein
MDLDLSLQRDNTQKAPSNSRVEMNGEKGGGHLWGKMEEVTNPKDGI